MHSTKTQRKFIQLRSQGFSFARISEQLRVSKPTLLKWNRWFEEEIDLLTALERENSHENLRISHQADLTRLSKLQDTLENELAARNLSKIPTEKLFRLAQNLRDQIQTANDQAKLLEKQKPITPDGLTRLERMRENLNDLRIWRGKLPLDEDGNEIQLDPPSTKDELHESPIPPTDEPQPTPVNKRETSSQNSPIS